MAETLLIDYSEFARRADALRARIAAACAKAGRDPGEVVLLAVTKTHPAAAAEYAARYRLRAVGENRVQEGVEKRAQLASSALTDADAPAVPLAPAGPGAAAIANLRWELIGHLQTNKARLAVQHFDRIQSVDREKLLDHLDRAAAETGKTLPVLLQVNAGNDPAKFGAEPADAPRLLESALAKKNLRVEGLMTIAPLGQRPAETAAHAGRTFAALRVLRDELAPRFGVSLSELSMGMTGDLEIAVAAGSTIVRVGTALYGSRDDAVQI